MVSFVVEPGSITLSPCGRGWRLAKARRRVRGFSPLAQLCEDVLQYSSGFLQDIIVPVPGDLKTCSYQDGISLGIPLGRGVLAAINLNDQSLIEADEIED